MTHPLKAPFPYFGGKSRIAPAVWQRFGNVANYVEPFAGSLAVLLQRPHAPQVETVNDLDTMLANFWRAVQHDPEQTAHYADHPVNEVDLHARHTWLVDRRAWVEELMTDPDAYDAKIAGWWVWGISQWIGSGWCSASATTRRGDQPRQRPHLSDAGTGVASPSLQIPYLSSAGMGIHTRTDGIYTYFAALQARLRRVRVCCGDWTRVLGPSVTTKIGTTAVFLDPPYAHADRDDDLYTHDQDVFSAVREWAIANGDNPQLRIALCGYGTTEDMPPTWYTLPWKAAGGYGSQGAGRGRTNAKREMVWLSPHCIGATLFDLEALA